MGFLEDLEEVKHRIKNQKQLAADVGLSQQTLSRIKTGDIGAVTARNIAKLLDFFGFKLVSPDAVRSLADPDAMRKEILASVIDVCLDSTIDPETQIRIIAAVKGYTPMVNGSRQLSSRNARQF